MRDFMKSAPFRIGTAVRRSYELQMRYAAWTYDLTYRLWYLLPFLCPPVGRFMAWLTGRGVLRWSQEYQPDVVVATYPLASTVLGQLRRSGRLDVPAVNFITDFGIHPLWVHSGIDLNMAVHTRPAEEAATKSGRPTIATGPMVSSRFSALYDREATRAGLGLSPQDRAVLIVAGSWGVGGVAKTFRTIASSGKFVPIAVCGRDRRLQKKLGKIPGGRALGWRDDMPALMAAADCLVENAGGLTSMEALSVGLPIISFKPIAGHGKENTAEMADVGVSRCAKSPKHLLQLLDAVTSPGPTRSSMIKAGQAMFMSNPADHVLELAAFGVPALAGASVLNGAPVLNGESVPDRSTAPVPVVSGPSAPGPRRPSVLVARIAAAVAAVPLLWAGLTTGVGMVTAYGAGVAHPPAHVGPVAYLGVRLDEAELVDPAIQRQLASLRASAVVDRVTAELNPQAVQHLASLFVDVESGGAGPRLDSRGKRVNMAPWSRASADAESTRWLARLVGQRINVFVPGRRVNAFDLVASHSAHSVTVVPNRTFGPDDADENYHLRARHIYLVNGVGSTNAQLSSLLNVITGELDAAHLQGAPLVELH
jgi:UDP-N-acetylglucosamine:LPS N-acetylglucosamine transferase